MDIKDIIAAAKGATALAAALGCHRTAIVKWRRVPAERVPAVSALTGIPRHVLRPDMWEPPALCPAQGVESRKPPSASVAA